MSAFIADDDYARLKGYVIASTGLAYYRDKDPELMRHIGRRVGELGLRSCAEYLDVLHNKDHGEAELDALIAQVTIGETYFFRHTEQFDALRLTVLPDILARNRESRRLRIWSAGCAIGAEPYSIASLISEFEHRTAGWDVFILGTDINRQFLARAMEGRFEDWAFRGVPEEFRQRYFRQAGKSWYICDALRSKVKFQYHNLARHTYPSLATNLFDFDLIVCRNVMIYFEPAVIATVLARFRESLADGGWLIVGHAESAPDLMRDFRVVCQQGAAAFQKPPPQTACDDATTFTGKALPATNSPVADLAPPLGLSVEAPPPEPRPAAAEPRLRPTADIETVRRLSDCGEWQQAAAECRKLLEADGLNPLAHFYNALIFEQAGAAAEARQELQRAIYLDRGFALAHYHLGLLQQRAEEAAQAARSFENVLELLSRHADEQALAVADGMTAAELRELARAHLEVLRIHG